MSTSADYGAIRQYVIGCDLPDDLLRCIVARLNLDAKVASEAINFVNTHVSLLQMGGATLRDWPISKSLMKKAWFVVDGSDQMVQTTRGARP